MILLNTAPIQTQSGYHMPPAVADKGKGFVQKLNLPVPEKNIAEEHGMNMVLSTIDSLENNLQLDNSSLKLSTTGSISKLSDALKEISALKTSGEGFAENFSGLNISAADMLDLFSGGDFEEII